MGTYDSMQARDAQKRDVAVQAERHWWVTRLRAGRDTWAEPSRENHDRLSAYVDALIEERTR